MRAGKSPGGRGGGRERTDEEVFGAAFAEKFLADGLSLRRRVCGANFFSLST